MDARTWQRAKEWLIEAAALPESERAPFLAERCPDAALRQELLEMLASDATLSGILHTSALLSGTRLGPYQIDTLLGRGGMGEVYRARDTKLGRDVALKVLPSAFAADPDRLARLEREARLLAALNHPNIAHVYGLEESNAVRAIVMELVEGETLADRLTRGAIPMKESWPIARQICEALEVAHEQGIIHRDLKPANIKVRPDGNVKVLDFGLAKFVAPDSAAVNPPTLTVTATQQGLILGTAAYMSPEQATGKSVDRRTDLWSFGVVLMEMLTGRRVFVGESVSHVIAAVLKTDPDWTALPADTPSSIRRLLRRCLDKDPRRRLESAGDARLELDDRDLDGAHTPVPRRPVLVWMAGAAVFGLALGSLATFTWSRSHSRPMLPAAEVVRLSFVPQAGLNMLRDASSAAISPNGRMVVITARQSGDPSGLWVRSMDGLAARPLGGDTHGALMPFWSPDSRHIGFFADQKLKTVDLQNGHVEELAAAPDARGGTWNQHDLILFAPASSAGPLMRVAASGGAAVPVVRVDDPRKGRGYRFPQFLPDGDHFLAAVTPLHDGAYDIVVGSLGGAAPVVLLPAESTPVFSAAGSALLFVRKMSLLAQPFDTTRLALSGEPVPLGDSPAYVGGSDAGPAVSVSASGSVAYAGPIADSRVVVLDQAGRLIRTLNVPPGNYRSVWVTRDGRRAALARQVSPVATNLWEVDLDKSGLTLLTDASKFIWTAAWAPDGDRIAYSAARDGPPDIYVTSVTDKREHVLYRSPTYGTEPFSWSPDSRYILATGYDPVTARDIVVIPAAGQNEQARPYLSTSANEAVPRVSPDGHWLAYISDKSGQNQLYVDAFPSARREVHVSMSTSAANMFWRTDSRQLLIVSGDQLLVADVRAAPMLDITPPRIVGHLPKGFKSVSATGDLQRVVALVEDTAVPVTIVEHWPALLDKR